MTSTLARLAAFAAALAAVFGVAAVAGGLLDPGSPAARGEAPAHGPAAMAMDDAHGVRGLAVAEDGLRLVAQGTTLTAARPQRLRFRITDADGAPVTRFDLSHERRMHVIVARRDLTGFQHVHPTLGPDGTWTADVAGVAPGAYRLFADFARDGTPHTLATDLAADGPAVTRPLPAPAAAATTDGGLRVTRDPAPLRAGTPAALRFRLTRDGRPARLAPYLGARGHLVVLREGDLGFLHVHPEGDAYEATFPTPGRYRLFLQVREGGRVQTVAFTQEVTT